MGSTTGNLANVAQFIELAIAPVFLLTAVAATLTVLTGRLARIVDRGRHLEARTPNNKHDHEELLLLEKRAQLIYRALLLGVSSAILVALLMSLAFAGEIFRFNTALTVAVFFMAALLAYTGALLCLLREVFLAIGSFRLGIHTASPP